MTGSAEIPLPYRIVALMQERNRLFAYPLEQIAADIWAEKFGCICCGACCTRRINNHIFLLDHDATIARHIDPASCVPAPDPEFCDQHGTLYVSGYALRMREDAEGSCWFLESDRCRIYDQRFSGCRIYPHMLRRSAGVPKTVTWRQVARRGRHGRYDPAISYEECLAIAQEVKEYENAYLTQQISFLEAIHEYFAIHNLYHDPLAMEREGRRFADGEPVTVKVFDAGELESFLPPGLAKGR